MANGIFGTRYAGTHEPAWKKLGFSFEQPPTVDEAVEKAGLNYQVSKRQMKYGDQNVPVPGKFLLVREALADDPTERVFGTCGSQYQVLQQADMVNLVGPLTDEWPIETVGALGEGETAFLTLDAGPAAVKADPIQNFFLVTNSITGGRAVRIAYTPVRVESQTVLVTGLAAANLSTAVPHLQAVNAEVKSRVDLLAQLRKAQQVVLGVFEKMAATKITDKQVMKVVEAAFPAPATPGKVRLLQQVGDLQDKVDPQLLEGLNKSAKLNDYRLERLQAFRDGTVELYQKFNEQNPDLAYTAWAIYLAVCECADYRQGSEKDGSVDESALFGPRAKEKAQGFKAAASLVK